LGTNLFAIYRGVTHPVRMVTVWDRGVRRGVSASRPDQIAARVPGIGLLNRTFESWAERHEVQLLRGLP